MADVMEIDYPDVCQDFVDRIIYRVVKENKPMSKSVLEKKVLKEVLAEVLKEGKLPDRVLRLVDLGVIHFEEKQVPFKVVVEGAAKEEVKVG